LKANPVALLFAPNEHEVDAVLVPSELDGGLLRACVLENFRWTESLRDYHIRGCPSISIQV
jgi:hypothetical protein